MPDPLLKATQRKRAALEAKLSTNPDFVLWKALTATEAALVAAEAAVSQAAKAKPKEPQNSVGGASKPVSKAGPIIEAAIEYLREQNHRMTSTQMAPALIERGIKLEGKNPASILSAYLSTARQIDNVRGEGYGLVEWREEKPSQPESKAPDGSEPSGASDHHGVVN